MLLNGESVLFIIATPNYLWIYDNACILRRAFEGATIGNVSKLQSRVFASKSLFCEKKCVDALCRDTYMTHLWKLQLQNALLMQQPTNEGDSLPGNLMPFFIG